MSAGSPLNSIYGELRPIYIPTGIGYDDPREVGRALADHRYNLTPKELEALEYVASGLTNGELAIALNLTEDKVKDLLESLYKKLGVNNRTEAAFIALRFGLGEESPKVRRPPKNS